MLPGLWLTPAQAYAVLTLNNMVEKIAPNVLGPFLDPMRGLLKRLLGDADFPLLRTRPQDRDRHAGNARDW